MGKQSRIRATRSMMRVFHTEAGLQAANAFAEDAVTRGNVPARALRRTLRELLTGHRSIQTIAYRWFQAERHAKRYPEGWNVGEVLTWAHKVYKETGERV